MCYSECFITQFTGHGLQAWMGFTKAGGLGGAQRPPFANTRIRATFPNGEHGDDMMLVFYCTHGLVTVIFIMILILTIISTSNSNGNTNNNTSNRTRNNTSTRNSTSTGDSTSSSSSNSNYNNSDSNSTSPSKSHSNSNSNSNNHGTSNNHTIIEMVIMRILILMATIIMIGDKYS